MNHSDWKHLVPWYRRHRRNLPFRDDPTPYRVWISEIMLQQTRVSTMIPYYQRFLESFPDVDTLARVPLEEVLRLWSGLGYYRRARQLHAAAQILARDHNGQLPADRTQLLSLPGIGPYTAGAILSIAFDRPEPILDGNVVRVLTRVLGLHGDPSSGTLRKELWSRSADLVPQRNPGDFNQGLMELGAILCTLRNPECLSCPMKPSCRAYRSGNPEAFPEPKPRKATRYLHTVALVVTHGGRLLLNQREDRSRMTDLWEFPTWNLEPEKDARSWIARNTLSELGFKVLNIRDLGVFRHSITHHRITCRAFQARRNGGGRIRRSDWRWTPYKLLPNNALTASAKKISALL